MDAFNVGEIVGNIVGDLGGCVVTNGDTVGFNDGDNIVGSLTGVMLAKIDGTIEGTLEEPLGTELTSVGAILAKFRDVVEGANDDGFKIEGVLVLAKVGREVEIA